MQPAVNIADVQVRHLRTAASGGIEGHEQDAMEGCQRCINKTWDFLLAEYWIRRLLCNQFYDSVAQIESPRSDWWGPKTRAGLTPNCWIQRTVATPCNGMRS